MKEKLPLPKLITGIVCTAALLLVFVLLALWTVSVRDSRKSDELRRELDSITAQGGERALLSLGGYEVDNIFYSDEGLILFEQGNQDQGEDVPGCVRGDTRVPCPEH